MITDKRVLKHLVELVTFKKNDIQIVQLLANDLRPPEIAKIIGVGNRSVEGSILRLRNRFECKTVGALVALFFRHNLIK